MATYNFHRTEITCPWCYRAHALQLLFKLGRCGLTEYTVGDRIEYTGLAAVREGGRPANGDWDAEGYGECPSCERDFFVDLAVRGDVLVGADLTSVRKAFMAGELGSPWGQPAPVKRTPISVNGIGHGHGHGHGHADARLRRAC